MQSGNFFEWLGALVGAVIGGVVHALNFVVHGLGHAAGDFTGGLAGSLGIHDSMWNIVLLVIGLLLLLNGIRALLRRAILAGAIWILLAALVLGKLAIY